MRSSTVLPARALPHGASAAAIVGWVGGAMAWLIGSRSSDLTQRLTTFGRADQWLMLTLGACVGALVLAARARHRRESIMAALPAGVLLGGAFAIAGATLTLLLPTETSARGFLVVRAAGWGLTAALTAAGLAVYMRPAGIACVAESALLACIGGIACGAIASLPGPAELWLPLAMTWFGTTVGLASVGPSLWHAPVVLQFLPVRGRRHGLWSLQERSIDSGWSVSLGEAGVGCVDGRVFVYPPPGGASIDGHSYYRPVQLQHDALLTVGRARYRVIVSRWGT